MGYIAKIVTSCNFSHFLDKFYILENGMGRIFLPSGSSLKFNWASHSVWMNFKWHSLYVYCIFLIFDPRFSYGRYKIFLRSLHDDNFNCCSAFLFGLKASLIFVATRMSEPFWNLTPRVIMSNVNVISQIIHCR